MQIRAISELSNLNISYNNALEMPNALKNKNAYIEVSYKDNIAYDSLNINLTALLECLYTSIRLLCSEVETLRNNNYKAHEALSNTNNTLLCGIYGYNKIISDLSENNSTAHQLLSAGTGSRNQIKGYNTCISELRNTVGANYLNKNEETVILKIKGPIVFTNRNDITGTITNALTANFAKWN